MQVQQAFLQYLSGADKHHTVQLDFFYTKGMNRGRRSKITVPES
jgi:hypothetical protein